MKRLIDILFGLTGFISLIPVYIFIAILIKFDSKGPIIFWSKRFGKNNKLYKMPKFRTMYQDTPQVASHLLKDSERYISKFGKFLRKYSLDELPQIYSILMGDMSIIGPRPALFNQSDLIKLRIKYKIDKLKPGLTGWAQVNGRDTLSIKEKVALETFYLENRTLLIDMKIIYLTIKKVFQAKDITH